MAIARSARFCNHGNRFFRAALLSVAFAVPFLVFCEPEPLARAQTSPSRPPARGEFVRKLTIAAIEQTRQVVRYDPSYVRIPNPGGDVPANTGVCTDVLIRAYRAAGVDLQKAVHEDMQRNFSEYPRRWAGPRTDTNIDHRRVPNLMAFFRRQGEALPLTLRNTNFSPGDIVAWDLGGGILHIGLVVDNRSAASGRWMIVHNIGQGPKMEDVLFSWKIVGHYRYFG